MVVEAGETVCEPVRPTVPIVLTFTVVAFSTTQESTELRPKSMVAGFGAKLMMRGRPPVDTGFTVTVAVAVAVCVPRVAVST